MLKLSLVSLVFCLVAGSIANANQVDPCDALLLHVRAQSVFQQTTTDPRCPKYFTMIELDSGFRASHKAGDHEFYLSTNVDGKGDVGSFTHENNRIVYRPGLKEGRTHVLDRDLSFPLGVAYVSETQFVQDGVLIAERSAKVASVVMLASVHSKLTFDANLGTFNYFFSGNGIEDVDCMFVKVPN